MASTSRIKQLIKKRHDLIPGGAHTYSKGDDQFPEIAPKAIVKGKGAYVWADDGNKYLDWCMGLRSVSLGHAYGPVVKAVAKQMNLGMNFGRPALVEFELAEHLTNILPNADMVKFAKNGSTVTTAATKLARAYTGRKYIAVANQPFFSYDDWFIGTTAADSGIPEEIKNLTLKFNYNDIASLEKLFADHPTDIACVILEAVTTEEPKDNFLKKAEALCRKYGTVFIIDEMITGFRYAWPSVHKKYDITPDLTTYGKGIANGFSLAVLAGKKEIMELGGIRGGKPRVFLISTTHGAETTALVAALAALREMKQKKVPQHLVRVGTMLKKGLEKLIKKYELEKAVDVVGFPVNLGVAFRDPKGEISMGWRTLFLQEVIKRGILFQGYFAISYSHKEAEIKKTLLVFDNVMREYREMFDYGDFKKFLIGEPTKPVFRKFN